MFVISLLAAPALLHYAPDKELTLQQVLKANAAVEQAIRSIHVAIEVSHNMPVSGEEKPPLEAQPTYTIDWYKDGNRQRIRQTWLRGQKPHSSDIYNGPDGFKRLSNYDPNFKPPLSESIERPASGLTDRPQLMGGDFTFAYDPRWSCFMRFSIEDGRAVTLEEWVTTYPSSKLAATPATSKLGCYEITTLQEAKLTDRESKDTWKDVKDARIFVDPKVGFWVRRIEYGPWQKRGDKSVGFMEVQEFKDCGNGVFWPLRAATTGRLPGKETGFNARQCYTLHSINQPLADEDFQIHFPDWLRVYDESSGKVTIWGPDDKPRMTFASQAEYLEWFRPRMKDPYRETSGLSERARWAWLIGISLSVGLMLALILWWRNKTSRRLKTVPGSPEKTSPPGQPGGR